MDEELNHVIDESRANYLDKDNYDVIVVGTGFVESLVAGALARVGKSVLHLDQNCYYGVNCSSFTLNQLSDMLTKPNDDSTTASVVQPILKNPYIYYQQPPTPPTPAQLPTQVEQPTPVEQPVATEQQTTTTTTNVEESTTLDTNDTSVESTTTTTTATITPVVEKEKEKETVKDVFKVGRQFIIDLFPSLLYAKGALVQLLISSSTSKYLEFKTLDKNYLYANGKLHAIPSTKGSIFKDNTFSLKEKRYIMKFIESVRSIVGDNSSTEENNTEEQEKQQQTGETLESVTKKYKNFVEFVKSYQMSSNVETFILYGICLIHPRSVEQVTVEEGILSVLLYMTSLLVYGESPFLIPYYGYGDIPQAFCRLCAVFGGTFVLDRTIGSINFNENQYTGITCSAGQPLTSKYLIASPSVLSPYIEAANLQPQYTKEQYSRCILITDKVIVNSSECSYITIPPNSIAGNKSTINVYQMENICVARGYVLIHFTTLSNGATARDDLEAVVETFAKKGCLYRDIDADSNSDAKDSRPNIIWSGYFNMDLNTSIVNNKSPLSELMPKGIFVSSDSPISASIDYQSQINEAKSIFSMIVPGVPFLEKVPDSEDIIWNSEEEQSATTNETTTTTTTANTDNSNLTESNNNDDKQE
ncbi:Rab escort protein [Heterostelium album PN500]|uniref:Rab escort protein 1 n=1 Tax=Heterostelium pallidum (strain ATCC 26659 / Pp 5 / PN500) TaxID=670386 RepID=D3AZG4_HETP5|nr:Rab escort protein [Heterostelium album PN500]EFA85547.1 Rab escort protein [Heterostelium album PN500]|eukprot:XP_020437655.1 Rab escort protein [Heterostelium album PN500]